jgi:hypothetical protein
VEVENLRYISECNSEQSTSNLENIPLGSNNNLPLGLLGQTGRSGTYNWRRRQNTNAKQIENLAVTNYNKNGNGVTFKDLLSIGMALHKKQAQTMLKHYLNTGVLFTPGNYKPQRYYPSCLKCEISKRLISKNVPVGVTGVSLDTVSNKCNNNDIQNIASSCTDSLITQSLEGYVLPLLPLAPLHIHKMEFKLKIKSDYYHEISIPSDVWNLGKKHEEIIGSSSVSYHFYANGTIVVYAGSSNKPFKIEDDVDRGRLMAFFGQIRDRLVLFLMDKHERIVPDVMQWELTQFDINRDIKVSDWMQVTGLKIQIKHLDHLFRIYIKSMQKDTVCRVEESISNNKPSNSILDTITKIFNPTENLEKICSQIIKKQDFLISKIGSSPGNLQNNSTDDVMIVGDASNGDFTN